MKNTLFLLILAVLCTGNLYAQEKVSAKIPFDSKYLKRADVQAIPVDQGPIYKTSVDSDTMFTILGRCGLTGGIFYQTGAASGINGYYSGTAGEMTVVYANPGIPNDTVLVTEHGIDVKLDYQDEKRPVLVGLFVWFTEKARQVGSSDNFNVNVYNTPTPTAAHPFTWNLLGSASFSIETLNLQHAIPFPVAAYPNPAENYLTHPLNYINFYKSIDVDRRVMITMETKHATSDDTLTFHFTRDSLDAATNGSYCDPGDTVTWRVRLKRKNFTHFAWRDWNGFFINSTFTNDYNNVPIMVPVFDYVTYATDRENTDPNLLEAAVYPNPTNGQIFIDGDFSAENPATATIMDMQGKKVWEGLMTQRSSLTNTNLSSGTYLVKVTQAEKVYTEKVIVR